jgi:hypothetical protein
LNPQSTKSKRRDIVVGGFDRRTRIDRNPLGIGVLAWFEGTKATRVPSMERLGPHGRRVYLEPS